MTEEKVLAELLEQIMWKNIMKKELALLEQEHRRIETVRAENLRRLDALLEEMTVVQDFMKKELANFALLFELVEMLIQKTIRGLDE